MQVEIDMNCLLTHVVTSGLDRLYDVAAQVETASGKNIAILLPADRPQSLWWAAGAQPAVTVQCGSKSTRVSLLWTAGSMKTALSKLVS